MTANEYLGVDDAGKLDIIRRLVREKSLVDPQELADAIREDRRRGASSHSREREDQTADHDRDRGQRSYHSGRGHDHGLVPFKQPKQLTVKQLQEGMRKPNPTRFKRAQEAERARTRPEWWKSLKRPESINTRDWGWLRLYFVDDLTAPQIVKKAKVKPRLDAVEQALKRAQKALDASGQAPRP